MSLSASFFPSLSLPPSLPLSLSLPPSLLSLPFFSLTLTLCVFYIPSSISSELAGRTCMLPFLFFLVSILDMVADLSSSIIAGM